MRKTFLFLVAVVLIQPIFSQKSIYVPSALGNVNDNSNQWSMQRSQQSDNFILFWEAGYGSNPNSVQVGSYRVNINSILTLAEQSFNFYADSLKFITRGNSKTDLYKMIIRLRHTADWEASGSGMDNMIGLLTLTAYSGSVLGVTVAHEVGHCCQYQVHCDNNNDNNGWMYGLGENGAGGNCFWEMCAQWMAFKMFPAQQFTDSRFTEYQNNAHRHILHESPRYANYFIQDFWTWKHGLDFTGKLWRQSRFPEDPVDTYKRIVPVSQAMFNAEIYECAAHFASWDIPVLRPYGESRINSRPQPQMNLQADGYWLIAPENCPQNYGYNIIQLNIPLNNDSVAVYFAGKIGAQGYRMVNYRYGGWRFGFVAMTQSGERLYGDMHSASYSNQNDTAYFTPPANCSRLWLVVTGAPSQHWHHGWDDSEINDEQWAYQVKFSNTNLLGNYAFTETDRPHNDTLIYNLTLAPVTANTQPYPSTPVRVDWERVCRAFQMQMSDVQAKFGTEIRYAALTPNGSLNYSSTANAPGHWFDQQGNITSWGNNAYIFSELTATTLTFNIGQYPARCTLGSTYTIRQALVYTKSSTEIYRVSIFFNIQIENITDSEEIQTDRQIQIFVQNNRVQVSKLCRQITVRNLYGNILLQKHHTDNADISSFPHGIYLVTADNVTKKIVFAP